MKEEVVSYELLQIELIELNMPRPNFSGDVDELMWHYKSESNFSAISADKTMVRVTLSYSLYAKDDPQKTSICFIKTRSSFSADRLIGADGKLALLYRFLDITLWNLQGVYGAKTQNIFLGQTLPPTINFREEKESLKAEIDGCWT